MPIVVTHGQMRGDLAGLIARLKHLVHDLEHLANGALPPDANIARAPLLTPFAFGTREVPCLIGASEGLPRYTGHPERPSRLAVVTTSEVVAFAPEAGWVRTLGQFYRLGEAVDGTPATNGSTDPTRCTWPRREPGSH